MWVPVFIMRGLSTGVIDAGEEGGLGEVQLTGVQAKCFSNHRLNAATHDPDVEEDTFIRNSWVLLFLKQDF